MASLPSFASITVYPNSAKYSPIPSLSVLSSSTTNSLIAGLLFYLLSISKSFGLFFKIPDEEMIKDSISTKLMNKITYIIDFGNMLISRLVRVLLNPSISAPPPSWLADDSFAVCLAISPVTLFNILFPRLSPIQLAKKYDPIKAGIDRSINSIKNCPKIFVFEIPNDNKTAISFFLAFIHRNSSNETTAPANIREPANNLFAIEYIPDMDCYNAG